MVFTSWNLCWMHKPQKHTLELELPVEGRLGAARGQLGTQPALWADTIGQSCLQLGGKAPVPTVVHLGSLSPAGVPEGVLPAHAVYQAPTWWRFNSRDGAGCRTPLAFQ